MKAAETIRFYTLCTKLPCLESLKISCTAIKISHVEEVSLLNKQGSSSCLPNLLELSLINIRVHTDEYTDMMKKKKIMTSMMKRI